MKMHLNNIKRIYQDNLVNKSYEIAFLVVIFRFISPPFVYFLSILKVNPLLISYANLLVVIAALISFVFSENIIIPILLLVLWQFCDTLDGGVARHRGMISNYGGFIDQIAGMIMLAFFPIFVSFSVSQHMVDHQINYRLITYDLTSSNILMFGGLSSLFSIFSRYINYAVRIRFGHDNAETLTSEENINRILKILIVNIENIGGLNLMILLACTILDLLPFYVVIFSAINFLIMLYVLFRALIDYKNFTEYMK